MLYISITLNFAFNNRRIGLLYNLRLQGTSSLYVDKELCTVVYCSSAYIFNARSIIKFITFL